MRKGTFTIDGPIRTRDGSTFGTNQPGEDYNVQGGTGDGSGTGANLIFTAGTGGPTAGGGNINLISGVGGSTSGSSGGINITASNSSTGAGGDIFLEAGNSNDTNDGGEIFIRSGNSGNTSGNGGNITLEPGSGATTSGGVVINPVSPSNTTDLRFLELSSNGLNYVGFKAPVSIANNVIWTLPDTDAPATNYRLVSNGSGQLSWDAAGAGPKGDSGFGVFAYSKTQSNGTQDASNNMTVVRASTGVYDYTFVTSFGSSNYVVVGNPLLTTTDTNIQISAVTANGFRVTTGQGDNGGTNDTPTDNAHYIVVVGEKSTTTDDDMPAVQARRTTTLANIPLTFTDINFDNTDLENDSNIIEHDTTNRDRILIKEDGLYMIKYILTSDDEVTGRVRINDSTVIPGSTQTVSDSNNGIIMNSPTVITNLNNGDFLTVQIQAAASSKDLQTDCTFIVVKMQGRIGPQGPQGPAGTGDPDQNLWETFTADTGSTTANTTTDNLTIAGGTDISTSISGDTLTINYIGTPGDPDQNLWETVNADTGSTTANTTTDSLTIAGGTDISTSITGDTVTIDYTGDANQITVAQITGADSQQSEPMVFVTDTTRSNKVLSSESSNLAFGRTSLSNNTWLRPIETTNNDNGYSMPYDGTIVRMTSYSESVGSAKSLSIYVDNSENTNIITFTTGNDISEANTAVNIDFNAGQKIRVRCRGGGSSVGDTNVYVWVKWRTP